VNWEVSEEWDIKRLPRGFDFPNGKSREEWKDGNEEI